MSDISTVSNLSTIKGAYGAFAKGDVPAVLAMMDANISWTEPDGLPYAGTFNGPDAVLQGVFMRLGTEWDGFTVVPEDFIDGGDKIVATGTLSGKYKATSKSFKAPFAHVWTLSNGKAVAFQQYTNTANVNEAMS
jgi:uncharacterized protein